MPKLIVVFDLLSDDEGAIDLVSEESSSEASTGRLSCCATTTTSSSHSDDSSFLPRWTYLPDGQWLQVNDLFDDCDGIDEESSSTAEWYKELNSRRPRKR